MKRYLQLITVLLAVLPLFAFPCSPAMSDRFRHRSLADGEEPASADKPVPSPVVKVVTVSRGTTAAGSSCSDGGSVHISLEIPARTGYQISELGFEFQIEQGADSDHIFTPGFAYEAFSRDAKYSGEVILWWLDGHPRDQEPLDLTVNVRAVSRDGYRGLPTTFVIQAPVGKARGIFSAIFGRILGI